MSLILMESGDVLPTSGEKWSTVFSVSSGVYEGKQSLRLPEDQPVVLSTSFPDKESNTIIVGFRHHKGGTYNTNGDGSIVRFVGSGVVHIELDSPVSNGGINVLRGGTTIASAPGIFPPNGEWNYLEVKVVIDDAAGSVIVKQDGVEVINFSGDTRNGGTDALIDTVQFGSPNVADSSMTYIRDIVILNDAGTALNDFIGPVTVKAAFADAAGDLTDWTPNVGTNHEAVDEAPHDGDTTYVQSLVAGDRDAHNFAAFALPNDPLAVQAHAVARYTEAPLKLATFLRRAATNDDGPPVLPSGSWQSRAITVWEEDPIAAGPWTLANLNATQFGLLSVAP